MSRNRKTAAAVVAGALMGVVASCSSDCKSMKGSGSALASVFCGGEGDAAPEPKPQVPSACQPRDVMPQLFKLIDSKDPTLCPPPPATGGLCNAVKDLGTPACLIPIGKRACTSDEQCQIGSCSNGLCPCTAEYSPLGT